MKLNSVLSSDQVPPALLCEAAGRWMAGSGRRPIDVLDRATGDRVGTVPDLDDADIDLAIAAADRAFPALRALLPQERGAMLRGFAERVRASSRDLARLLTAEQGKPLAEAEAEVAYGASFVSWFAEETVRSGDSIPSQLTGARLLVSRKPVGPAAAITPWDFPFAMILRKAGAALAVGCPVISLPSSETPFSALARANASDYGLAAYVFGRDIARVLSVSGALDYGMVAVNRARFTGAPIPFGGFRGSGLGREGGLHGIEAFTELKYLCIGGLEAPSAA